MRVKSTFKHFMKNGASYCWLALFVIFSQVYLLMLLNHLFDLNKTSYSIAD